MALPGTVRIQVVDVMPRGLEDKKWRPPARALNVVIKVQNTSGELRPPIMVEKPRRK